MPHQTPNFEFADAIKQIWNTIKGLESKTASQVKDELLLEMEERGLRPKRSIVRDSNPLDYWGKGYEPDMKIVDFLAEAGIRRAQLSSEWLNRFLRSAGYSEMLRRERVRALCGTGETLLPYRPFELPARRGGFLGRSIELESALEALNSAWPVCLLEGMGGVGKTTLALEVAYACARQPREAAAHFSWPQFAFIVWTTAEDGRLSLDDLLDTIAHRLGYPGLIQKPSGDKRRAVADIMAQQSILLIVDNFETVTDLVIPDFIVRLPPGVKVLLTSREEEHLLAPVFQRYPPARIRIGGLRDSEALIFLRQEAESLATLRLDNERARLEAVIRADDLTLLALVKATDGNPKALALALGHVADNATPLETLVRDLYAASDSVTKLFDYFFQHAWERCSEDARTLWLVIPLFTGSVRQDALAETAGLKGRYLYDALEQVRGRSLLDAEEGENDKLRYRAHPMVRAFASAKSREKTDLELMARLRQAMYYDQLLSQYKGRSEDFPHLEEEIMNILDCIQWCQRSEEIRLFASLVSQLYAHSYYLGIWDEYVALTKAAIEACRILGDQALLKKCVHGLAAIAFYRRQLDQSEPLLLEEKQIAEAMGDMAEIAHGYQNLGQLADLREDFAKAEECFRQGYQIAQELGDESRLMEITRCLAELALHRGSLSEAKELFDQILDKRDPDAKRNSLLGMARLARLQDNEVWARSLLIELQEVRKKSSRRTYALLKQEYAELEASVKNWGKAMDHAYIAREIFHGLEMYLEETETQKLIERIEDWVIESSA